jgi:hypothetical protein
MELLTRQTKAVTPDIGINAPSYNSRKSSTSKIVLWASDTGVTGLFLKLEKL